MFEEDVRNIFRAYDIRGVYNQTLRPEVISRIGVAYGTFLGGQGKVTIAHDSRTSSRHLEAILTASLASAGIDIDRIGEVPIPTANFVTWKGDYTGGVYITASHNPAEYNGIRFRNPDGSGYTEKNIEIKDCFLNGDFQYAGWDELGRMNNLDTRSVINDYIDFLKERINVEREMSVVLDTGNGSAGLIAPYLFDELGHKVKTINAQVDGRFPGRESEPKKGTIDDLQEIMRESDHDFGVAYDGDGDRCKFVDNRGNIAHNEKIGILMARYLKDTVPEDRRNIIANISCSMILEEVLSKEGVDIHRVRVGDVYVCQEIKKHNSMMGLESSSHFFISTHYIFDDPMYASLLLTEVLAREERPLSEVLEEIPSYPYHERGYYAGDSIKFSVIREISKIYEDSDQEVTTIDGVRVDFEDGWFLLRPSNTEPKIRLFVEAHTEERAKELIRQAEKVLRENGVDKRT